LRLSPAPERVATARWGSVLLLAAVLFLNYVDRGALPTTATAIQDELGFSASELGLLLSAFFWSYALLQIPVGWLAERYGAQQILAVGLTLWAAATMLVGLAHSFTTLLLLRILLGVGESAGFPCVSKLLATVVPVANLGRANGVVAFAYLLGPAVGTFASGRLTVLFGWRATFLLFGALTLLWLLPWSRVRLPPQATAVGHAQGPGLLTILRQPSLWGTSLGHFAGNYTFYFVLSWLPYYLVRERGLSMGEMASLATGAYLLNALSALIAGWVIDRIIVRTGRTNLAYKTSMIAAHVGFVVCMLCMALAPRFWAFAAILGYQVLSGMSSPGTFAIAQIRAGPFAAGRWVGIQNAIANLAGIIAPALTGWLVEKTHHFTAALFLGAAVSVLGIVGWGWMVREVAPLQWPRRPASPPLEPASQSL
jgi:MFS family permease